MRRRSPWIALLALACLSGMPRLAAAQGEPKFEDLLRRVPETANAVMLVDVEGLLNSPMGRSENWRAKAEQRSAEGLGLAADATRAVVAMNIDLMTMEELFKLGMVELSEPPGSPAQLARREGGLVETVQNTTVVWTPRNMYAFLLPPNIVGFASPAERQKLGGWLRNTVVSPSTAIPGWADYAVTRARAGSQIALGLNLKDAISPQMAEAWLNSIRSLDEAKIDAKLLAARLSTAQSATLTVDVGRTIEGTMRIDFQLPIDYASIVAKDIILTLLDGYGAAIPDFQRWTAAVDGKSIRLSGPLALDSAKRILDIGRPPQLTPQFESFADTPPPNAADAQAPPVVEATPNDVLKASQVYFRTVADMITSLKSQDVNTYASAKIWYDKYAKQIEELPILGVDKDLLDWGYTVARTFREMANGINNSAKNQTYTVAGRPNGVGGAYYGGYGYYYANSIGYDQAVIKRQADAVLSTDLVSRFEVMESSVADMRRKMVEKYQVDF